MSGYGNDIRLEAKRLRRLGLSERAIADELEVSNGIVHKWLHTPEDTCDECGEALATPAKKCGWCLELETGGVPIPDLGLAEEVAA